MNIERATNFLISAYKWVADWENDKLYNLLTDLTDEEFEKYSVKGTFYRGIAYVGDLKETINASWSTKFSVAFKFATEVNPYIDKEHRGIWKFEGTAFNLGAFIQDLYDFETIDWDITYKKVSIKRDIEFEAWWSHFRKEEEHIADFNFDTIEYMEVN